MRIALQNPKTSGVTVPDEIDSAAISEKASRIFGSLRVVSVPIGHPDDITVRALQVLREADLIIAETTRIARNLLRHHGIEKPAHLVSLRPRRGLTAQDAMRAALSAGQTAALLCDAGTPGIADPGSAFVRAALDLGAAVTACPGPCAALVALAASGLPAHRFVFEGFPPVAPAQRAAFFQEIAQESRTVILYESAPRLRATLTALCRVCISPRPFVLACDLTKPTEQIWRGSLTELRSHCAVNTPRGEFVLLLGGLPQKTGA